MRRVALRRRQQLAPAPALGDAQLDRMLRVLRQRLRGEGSVRGLEGGDQHARDAVLGQIVLGQERLEQPGVIERVGPVDQARFLAHHPPAAQQQDRHCRLGPVARKADDIGIAAAAPHHLLGDTGLLEQPDLVAGAGRGFVVAGGCRLVHLGPQPPQQIAVTTGEEQEQTLDQRAVVVGLDSGPRIARSHAALDVVVEAGPVGALVVLEIAAGPDRKDAPHLAQRAAQLLDVGERPQVAGAVGADLAGHGQPRPGLLNAQTHVGEALVVLEQDVEVGPVLPDQRGFEQQGFAFGLGQDGVEVDRRRHELAQPRVADFAAQVAPNPVEQALGLAHVQHPAALVLEQVNPRQSRQILHFLAQAAHASLQTPRRR